MNRALSYVAINIACYSCSAAFAGTTTISDAGAKNIGSSLAYIAICEKETFVPVGTLGDLMSVLTKGFTANAWQKIKNQYQQSLHEKTQFSIAKARWISFRINAENYRDLEKVVPSLKAAVISADQ